MGRGSEFSNKLSCETVVHNLQPVIVYMSVLSNISGPSHSGFNCSNSHFDSLKLRQDFLFQWEIVREALLFNRSPSNYFNRGEITSNKTSIYMEINDAPDVHK